MNRHTALARLCLAGMALLLLTIGLPSAGGTITVPSDSLESLFVPDEILIGLKPEATRRLAVDRLMPSQTGIGSLDRLNQEYAVEQMSLLFPRLDPNDLLAARYGLTGVFKLRVPAGTNIPSMVAEYEADPAVAYAEPNLIYRIVDFPNDPDFSEQWALHNTGQTGGQPDADIDAPEAWDIEKGKPSVLIAIVDTGVDYSHPDLAGGRVRTDLDRDFINDDDDAMDDHGHGTYCAGIAAADTNNAVGIAGVCQGCQILPVKVLDSSGSGTTETVAQGIQYAAQVGAQIISMSLGMASNCGCSQTIAQVINYAFEGGSLLIAASGNDYDKTRLSYPAASPRVMSVGASDHRDQEADFSNRSPELDIVAPGEDIYSLDLGAGYGTGSGTSAAAPHVSGVSGLVLSDRSMLSNVETWWVLYQSADDLSTSPTSLPSEVPMAGLEALASTDMPYKTYLPLVLKSRTTFGRLNANQALRTSAWGQMYAPPDDCTTEPDCPPSCAAEVVLSDETSAVDELHLLRALSDDVLAQSTIGQRWIALYERHRFETALILLTDSQFRTQTRFALKQWLPLFQAVTYPNSVPDQEAILTSEKADAFQAVIAGLAARGSPGLQADLDEVQRTLEIGRFVGSDVRDAWRQLSEER